MRYFIITFMFGTPLENKYAVIKAQSTDDAEYKADIKWGYTNVSKALVLNEYNLELMRIKGKTELKEEQQS